MQIGSEENKYIEEMIDNLIDMNEKTENLSKCLSTLKQIIRNLIEEPDNQKYQSLRKSNPKIQQYLLSIVYCYEIILYLGFSDQGDFFIYDLDPVQNFDILKKFDLILAAKLENYNQQLCAEFKTMQIQEDIPKEILEQKRFVEEQKVIRENEIKEFEADKKYNLEVKKQGQSSNHKKINYISTKPKFIGSKDPKNNPKMDLATNNKLLSKPATKKYTLTAQLEERKKKQRAARADYNQQIKPLKKGGKTVIKTLNDYN